MSADIRRINNPWILRGILLVGVLWAEAGAGSFLGAVELVDYQRDVKPVLARKCYACHGALKQEAGLRLDTVAAMRQGGDSGTILHEDPTESLLLERVTAEPFAGRMPPEGEPLTAEQISAIRAWLAAGAIAPDHETPQADPRAHWAFQPLRDVTPPAERDTSVHPVDAFVQRRLRDKQITPAPPADAVTLVRRLFLDLHGLPPRPEELDTWAGRLESGDVGHSPDQASRLDDTAVGELIDYLLASPRYGERYAQHWLDLVRYADTHGFEVNTPREHAWPYRDYVIRAFNDDKPYDRFVFEQLAGDTCGEDAATGFLVAAAVLLPGQIGKDEESIRLARQDALDEIIVGTSASMLGLTIGCARCHDHKFDPITLADYYALQAFFAGVEYGDREIHDADWEIRQARMAQLDGEMRDLQSRLATFEPSAFAGRTLVIDDEDLARVTLLKTKNGHGDNPAGNGRGERDDPGDAHRLPNLSRGRYTWWDNVPGEDVFTWNPGVAGRFRLWISWGVHGSGVHTRDARYVLDFDGDLATRDDQREMAQADQYYFAGQTEGESKLQPLWSGLREVGVCELAEESRLILRGGETGTGITADVIVLQEVREDERSSGGAGAAEPSRSEQRSGNRAHRWPQLRPPVHPQRNVEQFAPRAARFVRFTTLETVDQNRHEPCLDELEVFAADEPERNVALAELGTVATSSGNLSESGIHQLPHIHDGRYGNHWSWISNEKGGGWVQLEFPEPVTIDRIIWGRDREGKFQDRLPVRYRLDVSLDGKHWDTVATSDDRLPLGTAVDETFLVPRHAPAEQAEPIAEMARRLAELKRTKAEWERPRLVFAGTFREPEETFVLQRGDPEQKLERIGPRAPEVFGDLELSLDADETARRVALARWLASPENPLTARVMVNRIWQAHFGVGLVETASDFGLNGAAPSHPELLDWLAGEFIRRGWSIKELHRLILSSDTFRRSSRIDSAAQQRDAGARWLWRYPSRRLEAESIRDSVLHVSGSLNLAMGGPGYNFFQSRGGLSGFPPVEQFGPAELRRMIYAHKVRMEPVPIFGAFDCPDAGQAAPSRSRSTTAIQALNLLNSPFMNEQADNFARRVATEVGPDPDRQIDRAFRLAVGRSPSTIEGPAVREVVDQYGLSTLCRVLLNSNEFLFLP